MAISKTMIRKKARAFASEWNDLLAKKIRVGQIQVDPENDVEYLPLIVEMSVVYHGFIEIFEKRVGLNFYGIKVKGKKVHILFSRNESLHI